MALLLVCLLYAAYDRSFLTPGPADRAAYTGDGIIPAAQTQVIWDVVAYQKANQDVPLPQGLCTLRINDDRGFDAARRVSLHLTPSNRWLISMGASQAGYLAPNDAVTFALYTGEAYLPLASGEF